MNYSEKFPLLYNFLGGHFPDSDLEGLSDLQVVENFVRTAKSSELNQANEELENLIRQIEVYWQKVSSEVNRRFANVEDVKDWLEMVKKTIEKGIENKKV